MEKTRLRIRFTKCGDLRWISHRDLARLWERLLRRAKLQLAFSQGFHPKPRINFPSALALGIEALDEVVELEVVGQVELEQIEDDIRREMPSGMELLKLESPLYSLGKARVLGATYRVPVTDGVPADGIADSLQQLEAKISQVMTSERIEIEREEKVIACDPRDPYFDLAIEGEFLVFSLPTMSHGSIRPSELLAYLGLGHLLESGVTLQRTAVHLQEPEEKMEPMQAG
jgi:radical SAM-linked protein